LLLYDLAFPLSSPSGRRMPGLSGPPEAGGLVGKRKPLPVTGLSWLFFFPTAVTGCPEAWRAAAGGPALVAGDPCGSQAPFLT